jgi:hypothetical protein
VRQDRQVQPVGFIQPKTIFQLADDNDPAEVTFPRAHAELAEGAHWLVALGALASCTTPP